MCAAAFEAALRQLVTHKDSPVQTASNAAATVAGFVAHYARVIARAPAENVEGLRSSLQACLQQQPGAAAAAAAEADTALSQLLALQVTCMKCGVFAGKPAPAAALECAMNVLDGVIVACSKILAVLNPSCGLDNNDYVASSGTSSSHTAAAAASSASPQLLQADAAVIAPWVAVLAHAALAVADLQQQSGVQSNLRGSTLLCGSTLDGVSAHLPMVGLPEESLLQLLQQHSEWLQQLHELHVRQPSSSNAVQTHAALLELQQLLQQLSSFAGAVIAQLPLRWACNSPGCVNLQQRSELALVGGKGCMCAGCRTAR
jgi:hypothetical protein